MSYGFVGLAILGVGLVAYECNQIVKKNINLLIYWIKKNRIFFYGIFSIFLLLFFLEQYGNYILFFSYIIIEICKEHHFFIFTWLFFCFTYFLISKFTDGLAKNGFTRKYEKNSNNRKYELATFNDAIARELMELRLDVISMKIAQDRQMIKVRGQDRSPIDLYFPDEFTKLYRIYQKYPKLAICESYETSKGLWAGIIILLDNNVEFYSPKFDVEALRKLHSNKKRGQIVERDVLYVHIFDPDIDERFFMEDRKAKVLSIKNGDDYSDRVIQLEITLTSGRDFGYYREQPDETIIKEIEIHSEEAWRFKCAD